MTFIDSGKLTGMVCFHWLCSKNVNAVVRKMHNDSVTYVFCILQHALLLPVLVHHVRYHMCLQTLDKKMGYVFKDRSLFQVNDVL